MAMERAKILTIGVYVKLLIYVSKDSFSYVIFCILYEFYKIWFYARALKNQNISNGVSYRR